MFVGLGDEVGVQFGEVGLSPSQLRRLSEREELSCANACGQETRTVGRRCL